ncbi:MAG TPA: DUF4070 domain-containing protein, partial [Cyanophyceae cyanobacterium]
WHRLQKEGRLLEGNGEANIHQATLINFIPTRPIEDIAREFMRCFWELYEPDRYLGRVYRHSIQMKPIPHKPKSQKPQLADIRALLIIIWRQGIKRNTRFQFWRQLFSMLQHNPAGFKSYLTNCAHLEHFIEYRQIVRDQIEAQLAEYLSNKANEPSFIAEEEELRIAS